MTDRHEEEPGSRYIDWFIPGLMGMNLMGGGLWGIGFVVVDMRVKKLLKRMLATPMRRSHFLGSILVARMVFIIPEMALLLMIGKFVFGMPIVGNVLSISLAIVVGAWAFSGVGLLIACRAQTVESVSGLMNLVMLPQWMLCGIFFSSKRFPDAIQPLVQALPLTQLNDVLRELILEGAGLPAVSLRLLILSLWGVVTFFLALKWFRWQ